jgi:hypothetical protein
MGADGLTCLNPDCDKPRVRGKNGALKKYCEDPTGKCRSAVSARRRRGDGSGRDAGRLVSDDAEKAAQDVLREELRPVIREAITEEVLDGIKKLVGHVPAAVQVAADALKSADERTRLDAATLLLRHSAGNKAIVPDINEGRHAPMTVVFGVPRPEDLAREPGESGVIEAKECDSCGTSKPLDQFVGTSDRCQLCFDKMRAIGQGIIDRTGSDDAPAPTVSGGERHG